MKSIEVGDLFNSHIELLAYSFRRCLLAIG